MSWLFLNLGLLINSIVQLQPSRCDSFLESAGDSLKHGNYLSMLNLLHQKSKKFRRQMTHFLSMHTRREMTSFVQSSAWLSQKISRESVESFKWSSLNKEVASHLPYLKASLSGALVKQKDKHVAEM